MNTRSKSPESNAVKMDAQDYKMLAKLYVEVLSVGGVRLWAA